MFENCLTVGEVKSKYRELCFQFHPDVSGFDSTAKMQEINNLYLQTLKSMDGQTRKGTDGIDRKYRYSHDNESALVEEMARIIRAKLPARIAVEIVGIYIWVSNTQRRDREALKALKLIWHGKRERWYWKPQGYRSHYNKRASYQDLKASYGCRTLEKEDSHIANALPA